MAGTGEVLGAAGAACGAMAENSWALASQSYLDPVLPDVDPRRRKASDHAGTPKSVPGSVSQNAEIAMWPLAGSGQGKCPHGGCH